MTEKAFKDYALSQIRDWIGDALSSDISPSEIVEAITDEIKDLIDYHNVQAAKAQKTLNLISGERDLSPEVEDLVEELNIEHLKQDTSFYDTKPDRNNPYRFDLDSFGLNPPTNVYKWKHNKKDDDNNKRNKKRNK